MIYVFRLYWVKDNLFVFGGFRRALTLVSAARARAISPGYACSLDLTIFFVVPLFSP